jgi:hypothetical protein
MATAASVLKSVTRSRVSVELAQRKDLFASATPFHTIEDVVI